jgi:integrase
MRTWHGRGDHTLLYLATQTGLRVSELVRLTVEMLDRGGGTAWNSDGTLPG